jgi:hypothetical protein
LPNEQVGERVTVRGEGIAHEGTIFVEVVAGQVTLGRALVTSEAEPGEVIHFMTEVALAPVATSSDGEVIIYTTSPVDGSIDQRAAVPVKLAVRSGASPTSIYTAQPSIRINPTRGRAGTEVTIVGAGFPPGGEVQVRIGGLNSGTNPHVYATTQAGQHGNIQASFTMPERWPSGEAIVLPELLILVSTPDYGIKATAEFNYRPPNTP